MRRWHLWEFNDLAWFPQTFRNALTAYLGVLERWSKPYHAVHGRILAALRAGGENTVVDLCTGNGVSALALRDSALAEGLKVKLILTDLFPSHDRQTPVARAGEPEIVYWERPVDARTPMVDGDRAAFRTLFTAFHHFRPADAAKILQSAVDARAGIAVAELTHRSLANCLKYLAAPLLVCVLMLGVRPIRWNWLCFTFLIPILPLAIAWDGMVSNLRTYSPAELAELVESVRDHETFDWQIGQTHGSRLFPVITFLIARPACEKVGGERENDSEQKTGD
jgi:hypothetical protein